MTIIFYFHYGTILVYVYVTDYVESPNLSFTDVMVQ